jgi:hypothetical protein
LHNFGPKPFKFLNYWLEHKGFLEWVKEGWDIQVDGVPMFQLYANLKSVKDVLKRQNLSCFGNLKQKVLETRDNLDVAQKEVIAYSGRADYLIKENECLHADVSITKVEESFLKQKS